MGIAHSIRNGFGDRCVPPVGNDVVDARSSGLVSLANSRRRRVVAARMPSANPDIQDITATADPRGPTAGALGRRVTDPTSGQQSMSPGERDRFVPGARVELAHRLPQIAFDGLGPE